MKHRPEVIPRNHPAESENGTAVALLKPNEHGQGDALVATSEPDAELVAEPAASEPMEAGAYAFPARRGPNIHRAGKLRRRSRFQVWAEGAPTTTRQAEVLNTAMIGSPGDEQGVVIGGDKLSGAIVAHDPMTAYQAGKVTSPNVVVLGSVGFGKSSLLKTVYVVRPLLLKDRRALVIDKKLREGEGEYAEVTRKFGAEPFRFDPSDPSRSTCLNLLDPAIVAGGGPSALRQLLAAVGELAGGSPLNEWHHKAISVAYRLVQRAVATGAIARSQPVIEDLTSRFPQVVDADEFNGLRPAVLDGIATAAASMQFRLERLLGDDLAGMFDRETSKHVQLHPKLTTFDISALPEDGPSVAMVMLAANAWLMGILTKQPGLRTNFVVEEGWHLLGGPGGRLMQSKSKLSRGLGLSLIAALHHITDVPPDSPAIAMIKEAQTVHLFRQERDDDVADCVRYFNLEASNAEGLRNLDRGEHLLKVGMHREIHVQHVRTAVETQFTETDAALIRRPRTVIPEEAPLAAPMTIATAAQS